MEGSLVSDLSVHLAGVALHAPTVLASGVLGSTASALVMVARAGAGAVTAKSCSKEPRQGHPSPCVLPWSHGLINAVGLSNPGMELAANELRGFKTRSTVPLIASVFGRTIDEFGEVAAVVAAAKPDIIEVNVSCPNVQSEFGLPFGADSEATAAITRMVKQAAGAIPVAMKLTVNCPSIARMALVCEENGADIITAINTVGPGMLIDTQTRRPVLANRVGGLSGPAILPLAVKSVYEIARTVRIPIIGTGGVTTADDALQLIMAGATAVGVGSGVYYGDLAIFNLIHHGIAAYLEAAGLISLSELRGVAHEC